MYGISKENGAKQFYRVCLDFLLCSEITFGMVHEKEWEDCISKLSKWPYKFVGIKLTYFFWNCFLIAGQAFTPVLLAMAYHSFLGSREPVNK